MFPQCKSFIFASIIIIICCHLINLKEFALKFIGI